MCGARRITICFPVISSPMACLPLKQQAALVIGFILFLPPLRVDQLYLLCAPIRDSLLRRPGLPCCSWAWALAVPDSWRAAFPSHTCCRAKHNTDSMAWCSSPRFAGVPFPPSPHNILATALGASPTRCFHPKRLGILLCLLLGVAITHNVQATSTPSPNRRRPPPLRSTREGNCGETLLNYHTT